MCYPLPKEWGKDFALNLFAFKVFDVVTGGSGETTSSTIKKAVKRAARKTGKKELGTGAAKTKRQQSVGKSSKTKNSRTATTKRHKKTFFIIQNLP